MTDSVKVAIITAVASIVCVLLGMLHKKLTKIHVDMNSRFDEWRDLIDKSAFARGLLEGLQKGQERDDNNRKVEK